MKDETLVGHPTRSAIPLHPSAGAGKGRRWAFRKNVGDRTSLAQEHQKAATILSVLVSSILQTEVPQESKPEDKIQTMTLRVEKNNSYW